MPIDLIDIIQLAPPFNFSAADDLQAPLPTDDFRKALRDFLLAVPGVGDAVDGRVYWSKSPPGAEMPFLVISRINQRTNMITTKIFFFEAEYQFSVFSTDDAVAESIATAAYQALLPDEDMEEIFFAEGREMTRIPRLFYGPDAQMQGMIGAEDVWMCHFDYGWLIGPQR
jgi:hypothetical protein